MARAEEWQARLWWQTCQDSVALERALRRHSVAAAMLAQAREECRHAEASMASERRSVDTERSVKLMK
jgi:hypothetical protein